MSEIEKEIEKVLLKHIKSSILVCAGGFSEIQLYQNFLNAVQVRANIENTKGDN